MNENDILLDDVSSEVIDYIRQLNFKKSRFGGYDKNFVLLNIQEICNIYEGYIKKIFEDNKSHIDLLNNEICDLRQKSDSLIRNNSDFSCEQDPTSLPLIEQANRAVAEKANRAIAEANSRISEANSRIIKLKALYEEAEAKLRRQDSTLQAAGILSTAEATASDIVARANEQAQAIISQAKSEADSLTLTVREELSSERLTHEERLSEFREKYLRCSKYFSMVLEQINQIEGNLENMIKSQADVDFEDILTNVYNFSQLSNEIEADGAQDTEPPLTPAKHM